MKKIRGLLCLCALLFITSCETDVRVQCAGVLTKVFKNIRIAHRETIEVVSKEEHIVREYFLLKNLRFEKGRGVWEKSSAKPTSRQVAVIFDEEVFAEFIATLGESGLIQMDEGTKDKLKAIHYRGVLDGN